MEYLILLVLCLGFNVELTTGLIEPITSGLVEPIASEVVEPIASGLIESITPEANEPIVSGLLETPGNQLIRDIIGPADENNLESTKERIARLGNEYGIILRDNEEDVTNEDNYVYPCDVEDLDCIREFLAENSDCDRVYGPVPDLKLLQTTALYSTVNATLTITDVKIGGFNNSKIIEFYYNKVTGNVVLAFLSPAITTSVPQVFISYRIPGKESIVKSDFAEAVFNGVIFTTILRKMPKLRMETAEIHAYVSDSSFSFVVGPRAFASLNPTVLNTFKSFLASFPLLYIQNFTFQGPFNAVHYIQNLLCDFHYELFST